jgi:hypothetical protein
MAEEPEEMLPEQCVPALNRVVDNFTEALRNEIKDADGVTLTR